MKKTAVNSIVRIVSLYTLFAAIAFSGSPSIAQNSGEARKSSTKDRWSQTAKDAWIAGKLESAYLFNKHLNPFDIDINVEHGVVTLTGSVESDIKKELAGRIAEGVDGVNEVDNRLQIQPAAADRRTSDTTDDSSDFGQWVSDATLSAVVRTKLAADKRIHSLDIGVETRNGVVTLSGTVDSPEVRELAETIARNTERVQDVENQIAVN